MKKIDFSIVCIFLCLSSGQSALARSIPTQASAGLRAAAELIERVVPDQARFFVVEQIPRQDGLDTFEVESQGNRIMLRGSGGVAIASALNWYLEHIAGITVANPLRPVALVLPLKAVPQKVRITTPYRYRYFFNYCTFSYSMAWWDWEQWQRMIDWMALKGINLLSPRPGRREPGGWSSATWVLVRR